MIEILRNGSVFYTLEDYGEGSTVSCQLMEHHYVILKFSTVTPIYFEIGDSVALKDFGYFELTSPYFPTKNDTNGGYDYELQLDAYYWKWKNKICKYRPLYSAQETSFELTATVGTHMQIILSNLSALGYTYNGKAFTCDYTKYNKEVFDVDKAFYVQYSSISIIDALNALCADDVLNCEWWVDGNIIYLGYCEMTGQTTFEQDDNLKSMSQSNSKADYITRLYAFGSDRNIPDGHFTGQDVDITVDGVASDYLILPSVEEDSDGFVSKNGYIENTKIVTNEAKAIEGVVFFDDEYPRVTAEVTDIKSYESKGEKEDGTEYTQTFYQLAATTSTFASSFRKGWILDGKTLMIKFDSGSMNGMEFECELKVYDNVNYFEVVVNEDYGRTLPDVYLHPKVGDKFFLYNWDSTKITETTLIKDAQQALYERAKNYYKKSMIDASNFTCVLDALQFFNGGTYAYHPLGEQVKLIHPMFVDVDSDGKHYRNSRVIGFDIKLDIPYDDPEYIIGEKASYSRLGQLESTVDSITVNGKSFYNSGQGSGGSSVYVIGLNDTTPASDSNTFSASRARQEFLSRLNDDTAKGVITFEEGLKLGEGLYNLDKQGNARLKSVVVNSDYGIDEQGRAVLSSLEVSRVTDDIEATVHALLGEVGFDLYRDAAGRSHLWVDELMVRVKAYFASLEIRKVSYSGGTQIFSNAGSTIVAVSEVTDDDGVTIGYKCYATADDGTTRTMNWWQVGDQALCQTFNVGEGTVGTATANAQNRYYWRLVTEVGQELNEVDGKTYDYVVLSNEAAFVGGLVDGDTGTTYIGYDTDAACDVPAEGDVIVQVGSQTNAAGRGNVIMLQTSAESAPRGVENPEGASAPAIRMYYAISDYSWDDSYLTHLFSPGMTYMNSARFKTFSGSLKNARPLVVNRGEWQDDEEYAYYEQVTHDGQLWTWMDANTTPQKGVAPSAESGWTLTVAKGETGSSVKVESVSVMYCISSDGQNAPTDSGELASLAWGEAVLTWGGSEVAIPISDAGWSTEIPEATRERPYLWTRTITTYSDGTEAVSYSVSRIGDDGEPGEDAVQILILTDRGDILKTGLEETTLTAYVLMGGEDVTARFEQSNFKWTRTSSDAASDTAWNTAHEGVGRTITVTKSEVFRRALFECELDTTKLYS